MNLLENEGLAWERFQQAMIDDDVAMCYDMSLKEFENSTVHDLFKICIYFCFCIESFIIDILYLSFQQFLFIQAMSKFMTTSRQAFEMDHERVRLETRVREVQVGCRR